MNFSFLACQGSELRNTECRPFFFFLLHNTPPCCPIYTVLHSTPTCYAAVMTQFPLWQAGPSGINKVNLKLPYLILPWIPASLRHAGTFAIWGGGWGGGWIKIGPWPKNVSEAYSWWQQWQYVLINLDPMLTRSVFLICVPDWRSFNISGITGLGKPQGFESICQKTVHIKKHRFYSVK